MIGQDKDCTGCAYTTRRLKFSQPRLWCKRYHRLAPAARCIDYRSKASAVDAALKFFKALGLK